MYLSLVVRIVVTLHMCVGAAKSLKLLVIFTQPGVHILVLALMLWPPVKCIIFDFQFWSSLG